MMTAQKFKKIVDLVMKDKSFVKSGGRYYLNSPEIIFVIGLQKSNFSNRYYFSIGYFIRQIEPNLNTPKETDGHIRARMIFKDNLGKDIDYLDLDVLNEENVELVENSIKENISKLINGYSSIDGIRELLNNNPVMLYQTTVKAKSFLGYA